MFGFLARRRRRAPVVFGVLAGVALSLLCPSLPGNAAVPNTVALAGVVPAHVQAASPAESMLALVNASRAAHGLGPLRMNSAMNQVALDWANQMAANQSMTHNPSYSKQIPAGWTKAAENVAQGYPTVSAMHNGWMNSPGHRANILGDFTDIGIAFVSAGGTTWGVENFAKYGASVPPPAPQPAPPVTAPTADPAPTIMPGPQPSTTMTPFPPKSPTPFPTTTPTPSGGSLAPALPQDPGKPMVWSLVATGGAILAIAAVWWFVTTRGARGRQL